MTLLQEMGFVSLEDHQLYSASLPYSVNSNGYLYELVKALICAGLYPNIARCVDGGLCGAALLREAPTNGCWCSRLHIATVLRIYGSYLLLGPFWPRSIRDCRRSCCVLSFKH